MATAKNITPPGSRRYIVQVPLRWSDMDVFRHINHARMVTLLEEARIPWLFDPSSPTEKLANGAVITEVMVKYQGQIRHDESPLIVEMWAEKVRAVDFYVHYEARSSKADPASRPAIVASTRLASFDIETQGLRRLTAEEREYLTSWSG